MRYTATPTEKADGLAPDARLAVPDPSGILPEPGAKRHPLKPEEQAVIQAFQRDRQSIEDQMRGALRVFLMARGIQGMAGLSEDGTAIVEMPAPR